MSTFSNRRDLLTGALAAGALLAGLPPARAADEQLVRIGYQKSSTLITVLKTNGMLEKRLAGLGVKVSWHEFASGLPLLEALNLGKVDFSADVADTVPVFALAAGAKLVYLAQEAPSPTAQALIVRADSAIKSVADLKGKRVAFAKAAGSHYLIIALLDKAGLRFSDIQPAYLSPADARTAFEGGHVDAWVIWDPFLTSAQRQANARVVADGKGVGDYQRYYLATPELAKDRPDVLKAVFDELRSTGQWVKKNPKEAATLLSPIWGLDAATVEQANSHRSYEVREATPASLSEQQLIANAFFREGLLPRKVNTSDVTLWKRPV